VVNVENAKLKIRNMALHIMFVRISPLAPTNAPATISMLLPMTTLTGMALRRLPQDNPERAKLEKVLEAGERAKGIVARLLSFSRMEQTEQENVDICKSESFRTLLGDNPSKGKLRLEVFLEPEVCDTHIVPRGGFAVRCDALVKWQPPRYIDRLAEAVHRLFEIALPVAAPENSITLLCLSSS